MVTLDDIRKIVMGLPEVEESTHFRLPSFKIHDNTFVVVQKDGVIFSVSRLYAENLVNQNPKFHIVTRNQRIFVGIRASLNDIGTQDVESVITAAYENKK